MRYFLLIFVLVFNGCASPPPYLDDNLSDRMQLATKLLGNKHIYFDSSKYGNRVTLKNGEIVEVDLAEVENGNLESLKYLLETAGKNKKWIAVTGRDPKRTAKLLKKAILEMTYPDTNGLKILYIGKKRFFDPLKKMFANRKFELKFAKTPATS